MKRLKAANFPKDVWEYGTAPVKRCLHKMREYAKVDFNILEEDLEEVVEEAMNTCYYINDNEVVWEALSLVIIEQKQKVR